MDEKRYAKFEHEWTDPWEGDSDIGAVVKVSFRFAKPGKAVMSRFAKDGAKSPTTAQNNLLLGLIHDDDKEELRHALEEHPGLLFGLANAITKASGFGDLGN